MARKAVEISTTTGELQRTPDLVEASEVASVPTMNGIPRAGADGTIAAGWIGPLPISVLPVADNGEVSSAELVRADDSRLGNPPVGGDLAGTAGAATVVGLLGRALANSAPADGDGLVWNQATNRWEPQSGGAGDAISLRSHPVADVMPNAGDSLVWNGFAWSPSAVAGGSGNWAQRVQLIGTVNGTNTRFALPSAGVLSTLKVYTQPASGGALTEVSYALVPTNLVLGVQPSGATGPFNDGGYFGSSPVSCLVDGARGGGYWTSNYTIPIVWWQFGAPKPVNRSYVGSYTSGGWGGISAYAIEYSDDGVTWLTAATDLGANAEQAIPAYTGRWWRMVGLSKGYYEWCMTEIELYAPAVCITSIDLLTAPANVNVFGTYEIYDETVAVTTELQGRPVADTDPAPGQTLMWTGTQWAPGAGASNASPATRLYLHSRGMR